MLLMFSATVPRRASRNFRDIMLEFEVIETIDFSSMRPNDCRRWYFLFRIKNRLSVRTT